MDDFVDQWRDDRSIHKFWLELHRNFYKAADREEVVKRLFLCPMLRIALADSRKTAEKQQ